VTFATAAFALVLLAAAIERYSAWAESWWSRIVLGAAALMMITPDMRLTAMGLVLAAVTIGVNRLHRARRFA
jgi:TRAP-type uncharacterized transport system fused permease subunit